jgi:NADP-dependent 3-hydroxy acid dehydrogenase YdfG
MAEPGLVEPGLVEPGLVELRIAVVTGGAGGIGGAIMAALADAGAALTGQTLCTDGGLILR